MAGLPGSVDVPAGFLVLDGSLVVAQRLADIPGPREDDAELVLDDCPGFVVVGGGEVQGLLVAAEGGVEVLQQH